MDTYSLLRQFADSWVLLAMFGFFLGAAIWAFLPSQSKARQDASMIPFRNDDGKEAACKGTCASCASTSMTYKFEDQHHV